MQHTKISFVKRVVIKILVLFFVLDKYSILFYITFLKNICRGELN